MNARIEINPEIQHGRPVIRGTRVPVAAILGELAEGMTRDRLAEEYGVALEDIVAALEFAADLVEQEQHRGVPAAAKS